MKLIIHSQTSTVQMLKVENGISNFISLNWVYDYLSILGSKLIHVSRRGPMQSFEVLDTDSSYISVNTLRPRQNGRHFPDDIFKWIFLNENVWIPIKISLKFVPKVPINNIPALVQIMAWRRPGDKPLSEPMMVCLLKHICVTRPKWVNDMDIMTFTVTSHERCGISRHQNLNSLFISLLRLTTKRFSRVLYYWPFVEELLVDSYHKGPVILFSLLLAWASHKGTEMQKTFPCYDFTMKLQGHQGNRH